MRGLERALDPKSNESELRKQLQEPNVNANITSQEVTRVSE